MMCEYCGKDAEIIFEVNEEERFNSCQSCADEINKRLDEAYTKALGTNWRELI